MIFEVLGDSNVSRNWKTVADYYEPLKGSIARSTTSLSALRDNLKTVSQTTELLIVAGTTNPLTNIALDNIDAMKCACADQLREIFDLLLKTLASNARLKVRSDSFQLSYCIELTTSIGIYLGCSGRTVCKNLHNMVSGWPAYPSHV